MRFFGRIPRFIQISRSLSYHAHFRPRSLPSATRILELASSASCGGQSSGSDHMRVQSYSQKTSNVFNIAENIDMLRKRISFSGAPNTAAQILPVGLITPEAGGEKDLKIVIVPLNLAGMDANDLKETLEAINQLRMYAHHIEAFSCSMVDEYNALNEAFQEVASAKQEEAKPEASAENNAFWDDFTTADAVATRSLDTHLGTSTSQQRQEAVSCLRDTFGNPNPAAASPPLKTSKSMSALPQSKPQPLAVEADLTGSDIFDEVQVDVPQDLSDRLNDMAVASMELSFEMDMTNLREALSNDIDAVNNQDPMICMHTKVEMSTPEDGKKTVPLRFNGLISGVVELDAQKLNLADEQMPGYNDHLTALAANLCSTALEKGFCKDPNLELIKDDTTMITPSAQVAHQHEEMVRIADQPEANYAYPLEVPVPTDKDGCKHPPVKPKRKCPGKCPLITDPCKEDPCKRPGEKEKPPKKALHTTEITASSKDSCAKEKDPCAKDGDKDGKKKDPCAKDGGKDGGKKDPCAKDGGKDKKDPCAKDGDKDGKKKDPCAKDGGKDKKDPCAKDGGKDKKDPCAKNGDKDKKDPCAKDGGKDKKDPCAKDGGKDKKDPCAKDGGKDKKDPCAKNGGKNGKNGKKDPCAKFKKGGKDGKGKGGKFSTFARHQNPNKRYLSTALNQTSSEVGPQFSPKGPRFLVYSTLMRRHYRVTVPERLVHNTAPPARFTITSKILRREYSKKKSGGKCGPTKYPKSRGKDIKERTGLREDCFKDDADSCVQKSCGGKCSKVKFPKKKCDRGDKNKKKDRLLSAPVQLQSQQRSFGTRACIQQSLSPSKASERQAYALRICDSYKVELVPMNKPSPKEFDVLIRTGSVAISGSDIHVYENGNRGVEAMSLGHDATGYVEEVGRSVQHLQIGDRVVVESALSCSICDLCKRGLYNMCPGLVYNGFLSTYQTHPADLCHRLPPSISMEEGALTQTLALGCQACFKGNVKPTSNVLVLGTCPTAVAAAICAQAMGARKITIAGCIGPALDMIARDFCFDAVEFDNNSPFAEVLETIYSKFRAWPNCVINCAISAMSMNLAVMALQPCGVCVLSECDSECVSFNALDVLMKDIRLIPSFRSANMYPTALEIMHSGQASMKKFIAATYPLCDADRAFRSAQNESNMGLGKVIVNCSENPTMGESCINSQ